MSVQQLDFGVSTRRKALTQALGFGEYADLNNTEVSEIVLEKESPFKLQQKCA